MAQILDGKKIAQTIREELAVEVAKEYQVSGKKPGLAVVLVGEDPASQIYVKRKEQACAKAGIHSVAYKLSAQTSMEELTQLIDELNNNSEIHGILVQLPLPKHLDGLTVANLVKPEKDVDGLGVMSQGLLALNKPGLRPCTPSGVMRLLKHTGIDLQGKLACVVGRSTLVGAPVARMLTHAHATVIQLHSRSLNSAALCQQADVLIAACGVPKLITADWVKKDAVVIDVGIHRAEQGLVGDVDFQSVEKQAEWITPVPGGVGPMTIACLLKNCFEAFRHSE